MYKDIAYLITAGCVVASLQLLCFGHRFNLIDKRQDALQLRMDSLQKQNEVIMSALGEIYTNTEEIKYR